MVSNTGISELISDLVTMQFSIFFDLEENSTKYTYRAAQYLQKAQQLDAQRELAQLVFDRNRAEQQTLYDSASKVLDKAIEKGEIELAQIAMRVINVAHSKELI